MTTLLSSMTMPDRGPSDERRRWLAASAAPWLLVAATVGGIGAGLGIDRWLGSAPWGILACSLAGIGAGIYMVIREGSR